MKRIISIALALTIVLFAFASCGGSESKGKEDITAQGGTVLVKFTMEDGQTFTLELYPNYAPETVVNFLSLVKAGEYDGTTFHRVINGFMAQGGAFLPDGTQKTAQKIKGEMPNNGFTQNTLKHERGVVSMARIPGDYNSASNQFFICYDTAEYLDGEYAAFGRVVEGMETVDSFLAVERTVGADRQLSSPVTPIIIEKAEVL